MIPVYIGLGSNLDDPVQQIRIALDALRLLPQLTVHSVSGLYRNPPMGEPAQPDYVNAVAGIKTNLSPIALLDTLQQIEAAHGRERKVRWGARTLDLDILLYGENVINHERLIVPHPGLPVRNFVLYPLYEIAPQLIIPGYGALAELLQHCPATGLERIGI